MFPQWVGEKVYVGASESLGVEGNLTSAMTQGNAVKAFRISETPFFEPSAMYNNNQTLLDVYDIRAKEKIKKPKFTIDKHIHLC